MSFTLILVLGAVRNYGFVLLDDALHVADNPLFHPLNLESFKRLWTAPFQGLYIPVTYSFWGLGVKLSQFLFPKDALRPEIFHIGNLLFHLFNSCLLYAVFFRCFSKALPALIGSLIFALHPVQVESIAWVSGFKDLACGFFSISAIFFYLNIRNSKTNYVLSLICLALALLCKPAAVVLPLMFLLLDLGYRNTPIKLALKKSLPTFLLILPILYLTRISQPERAMSYVSPWKDRLFVLSDALIFYLSKLVFPWGLSADYSRTPQFVMSHFSAKIAVLGLGALLILVWRRNRNIQLSLALFIVGLIPVLGLIPFYYQFFSTVADRYLYLSLIGPAFAIAWWLSSDFNFRKCIPVFLLLLIYGRLSHLQVRVWKNDETLFTNVLKTNPKSLMAHNNLGAILEKQERFEDAALHYAEAIEIYPPSLPARYNLGRVLARLGHFDFSIKVLETLIKMEPKIPDAHYTLAMSYRAVGKIESALKSFDESLRLNPVLARAYFQRGLTLSTLRRTQEAQNDFKMALEIEPGFNQALKALDDSKRGLVYNKK